MFNNFCVIAYQTNIVKITYFLKPVKKLNNNIIRLKNKKATVCCCFLKNVMNYYFNSQVVLSPV